MIRRLRGNVSRKLPTFEFSVHANHQIYLCCLLTTQGLHWCCYTIAYIVAWRYRRHLPVVLWLSQLECVAEQMLWHSLSSSKNHSHMLTLFYLLVSHHRHFPPLFGRNSPKLHLWIKLLGRYYSYLYASILNCFKILNLYLELDTVSTFSYFFFCHSTSFSLILSSIFAPALKWWTALIHASPLLNNLHNVDY